MQRHSAAIVPNVWICPRVKQQFGDVFVSPENRIVQKRITELVLNVRIRACVKQQPSQWRCVRFVPLDAN